MKTALEELNYEQIRNHILDPQHSQLSEEHAFLLERILSLAKVLDKNPLFKQAISIHRAKYATISTSQAYIDLRMTTRLFKTIHTFDYDFYQTWIIQDIIENILKCKSQGTPAHLRIVAMEHTNLLKSIGTRPDDLDPKRNEKHQFYIMINNNSNSIKLDLNNLENLPVSDLLELKRMLYGGHEITDVETEAIMNT